LAYASVTDAPTRGVGSLAKALDPALVAALLVLLGACQGPDARQRETVNLHQLMKGAVAPDARAIWDFSNVAINDAGQPSAEKLKADDWTKFDQASARLFVAATSIVQSEKVVAAAPNVKIQDEGTPGAWGAGDVQRAIDANPEALKEHARALAATANAFVIAGQGAQCRTGCSLGRQARPAL
jgi:hypothetical protein